MLSVNVQKPLLARSVRASAALDPDNASILVCGGAGVAMHTTRKLKDMGSWVWMMQRTGNNRPEIEKMMAFCVKGDALDQDSVAKVFKGAHHIWNLLLVSIVLHVAVRALCEYLGASDWSMLSAKRRMLNVRYCISASECF